MNSAKVHLRQPKVGQTFSFVTPVLDKFSSIVDYHLACEEETKVASYRVLQLLKWSNKGGAKENVTSKNQ